MFEAAARHLPATGKRPGLAALLQSDTSLPTLLKATAASAVVQGPIVASVELVAAVNHLVQRLQQPVAEREVWSGLAELQAGQPRPVLTFEQLLAYWVYYGVCLAGEYLKFGTMTSDISTTYRNSVDLLPQLLPHDPRTNCLAAMAAAVQGPASGGGRSDNRLLRSALHVAEQSGSDFWVAMGGYQLTLESLAWAVSSEPWMQEECPPSVVLSCLQQARTAHARCTALLPKQWTRSLSQRKEVACQNKPWLEQLAAKGDRWEVPGPAASAGLVQALERPDPLGVCSNCGDHTTHLRCCGGCKKSAHCSVDCQRKDWPQHKAFCIGKQQTG